MPNPNIEINALDGQDVSAATLRLTNFLGTMGGNGIALPKDLRVRALNVAGTAVQVQFGESGGAMISNPAQPAQSFATRMLSTENVAVPTTDSTPGGKIRYIIQVVEQGNDPGGYHRCVDSLATYANVPHIVLARINQPASTATITNSMITDLRQMAYPFEKTELVTRPSVMGDTGMTLNATGATGEWFPNSGGDHDVPIPWWATYVQIIAQWLDVEYDANVNPYGAHWVEWGPFKSAGDREYKTQEYGFNHFVLPGKARGDWTTADTMYIPRFAPDGVTPVRGTPQKFVLKARYDGADKGVHLDAYSGITLMTRFLMVPDQVD